MPAPRSLLRILFLAACLTSLPLHAAEETPNPAQQLRALLRTADRIVLIDEYGRKTATNPAGIILELKGSELIASLGDTVEISGIGMPCLCLTSPAICFYKGDAYRFSMTLHHGKNLRCKDGPWGGDAVMTDESAKRFHEWFAQHGFDGFVRGEKEGRKQATEQAARNERFLATLPAAARSLVPTEPYTLGQIEVADRAQRIAAIFDSRRDFILACWRGLGELSHWDTQMRRAQEEFIVGVLGIATAPELANALAALPANEAGPWLGAFQHYLAQDKRKVAPITTAVDDAWLAKLALRFFRDGPENKFWVIRTLADHPGPHTSSALLEIARTPGPEPLRPDGAESSYACTSGIEALRALAKLRVAEARALFVERLAASPKAKDRLVLEVALAHFDGPQLLKTEHLGSSVIGVGEAAWQLISSAPGFAPSVDDLVAYARSGCLPAREYAIGKLREHGLCIASGNEEMDALLKDPSYASAKTLPELDGVIDTLIARANEPTFAKHEERTLALLLHRRGKLLFANGEFEKARQDLSLLGGEEADKARETTSLVLQTLGYLDAARYSLSSSADRRSFIEPAATYLERRAFLNLAKEEYADAAADFEAALRLDSRTQDKRILFQGLALRLAGKPMSDEFTNWGPNPKIPGVIFENEEEDLYWPQTGISLLQGKITEEEILRRINAGKADTQQDLCEAHFVFSLLRRASGDRPGELRELEAALASNAYTTQPYSLAYLRRSQLGASGTAAAK